MKFIATPKLLAAALATAAFFEASAAQASVSYLGMGSLGGGSTDMRDLSGLSGQLENGVPNNLLGGIGSGFAYSGVGNRFLATPDRGPNAVVYNTAVDNTASYIDRFQEIDLSITQVGSSWNITPTLAKTTLLSSATPLYGSATAANPNKTYFTGLSSGFDPSKSSANANNMRLDPEAIRVSNSGNSVFITDEYGPNLNEFDRTTGQRIRSIVLPPKFAVATPNAIGKNEESNAQGRVDNKGMEGLAITPDGKTLYGIMQSPLLQDHALTLDSKGKLVKDGSNIRIVKIDIATGNSQEFVYQLANNSLTVSEILAINDHEFLVDERDGNGGVSVKNVYKIDVNGATDVSGIASLPASGLPAGVTAVNKGATPFLDFTNKTGLGAAIPEKIEGMAFGPTLSDGRLSLILTNDNDFNTGAATFSTTNNFYVFGIDQTDLNYTPQSVVPVPAALPLMLSGLTALGGLVARRRNQVAK